MKPLLFFPFVLCLSWAQLTLANEKPVIRIGSMASGTLNWELNLLKQQAPQKNFPFTIETVSLANQQAGKVAILSNSVDIIVSDWIWVSSMRSEGKNLTFYPYSNSAGGLIVPNQSHIKTLADLQGKKLGIAGGELDKNWILLQTLAARQGVELNPSTEKVFGAPPLLNQQLQTQKIDALLTFWQFAAQLESKGYHQLLSGEEMIRQLGIQETVPSLGYVFTTEWATSHKSSLQAFLVATRNARNELCQNEDEWKKASALTEATDIDTEKAMWQRYCEGRISDWSQNNQEAAAKMLGIISQQTDSKLTDKSKGLQPGTFWSAD